MLLKVVKVQAGGSAVDGGVIGEDLEGEADVGLEDQGFSERQTATSCLDFGNSLAEDVKHSGQVCLRVAVVTTPRGDVATDVFVAAWLTGHGVRISHKWQRGKRNLHGRAGPTGALDIGGREKEGVSEDGGQGAEESARWGA